MVVIAAERVWTLMPAWGLFWLDRRPACHTLGRRVLALERIRYFHFAWHLFVVAGTACHVVAVAAYSGWTSPAGVRRPPRAAIRSTAQSRGCRLAAELLE